jgi:hypothetical protein
MPITLGMIAGRRSSQATYVSTASSTANQSTYTFSGQSIGTAASNRYVVVAATGGSASSRTISSCTVGGAATTRVANVSGFECAAIFITNAPVTTGTTADVVIVSDGLLQMQSVVYVINGSPVLYDTFTSTSTNPSGGIDAASGGCIIAIATHNSNTDTASWTGLTENGDEALEFERNTWASLNATITETNRTIGVTFSSSLAGDVLVAASWRPS